MWSPRAPVAVLSLLAFALIPSVAAKPYPASPSLQQLPEELRQLHNSSLLEERAVTCGQGESPCGADGGYTCCKSNEKCDVNANNQAVCVAGGAAGQWTTSTYTTTDNLVRTIVGSSLIPGAAASTSAATISCALSSITCGPVCCNSGFWCSREGCKPVGGGSTPTPGPGPTGIIDPSAPLRPTSSTLIVTTATGSPTATVPFTTPIATGASGAPMPTQQGKSGLSGGAIAGIVIGVILGILLLLLLCLYCCFKSLFASLLALFGLGGNKRRRHEETTYIEEHHHSGSAAAAGGRRWHGAGSSRPARPPKKSGGGIGGMLGLGAGLAGLAAVLGVKRKHDQNKFDDKSTTVSSAYYSSEYTSTSSASSDDRRTRNTRQSSHR